MSISAYIVIELEDGEYLSQYQIDKDIELHQNYDAFSVLVGCRNYNNIKPMFSDKVLTQVQLDKLEPYTDSDRGVYESFTLDEIDSFDFDKPLEFLPGLAMSANPNYNLSHRAISVVKGDTYRTYIQRETSLFEWFDSLKSIEPRVKTVFVMFD